MTYYTIPAAPSWYNSRTILAAKKEPPGSSRRAAMLEGVHAVWQSAEVSAASAYDQRQMKRKEEEREEGEKEGEQRKREKSNNRKEIM